MFNNKTLMTMSVIGTLFITTFTACSKKITAPENIKIGAILPLTGAVASLGVPMKNAIELAASNINAAGGINGKPIEVVYEDSVGNPKIAVSAVQKLITADKIQVVISFMTGVIQAIKPITESNKVVLMAQSVYPPIIKDTKYTFRVFYSFATESEKIIDEIKRDKIQNIAFIRSKDAATEYQVAEYVIPKLKLNGVKNIIDETFDVGDLDFKAQVSKIKGAKVSAVVVLGFGSDFPNLIKELEQQGLLKSVKVIGGIGFVEIPQTIPLKMLDGVVFFAPPYYLEATPGKIQFQEQYAAKYGKGDITYAAGYAYDSMMLLAKALENLKPYNPDALKSRILALQTFSGITGPIVILPNGDCDTSVVRVTYKNGVLVKL